MKIVTTALSMTPAGSYKTKEFAAVAGKNNKNCKWCEFKEQPTLCPPHKRIKE